MTDFDFLDFQVCDDSSKEKQTVEDIISKFEELNFINNNSWKILVVKNNKKKIKEEALESGVFNAVSISKVSPKIEDIFEQITDHRYSFILEIASSAFENMSEDTDTSKLDFNQLKALVYFELRKITPDKKLRKSSPNDWLRILHGLGKDFDRVDSSCTDILAEDFSWEKVMGSYYSQLEAE